MFHIVEINTENRAKVWFAFDTEDFIRKVSLDHGCEPELKTCLNAVSSNHEFRIYADDESAAEELDRDHLYRSKLGFEAYMKLRAQLISMEVIAEDF